MELNAEQIKKALECLNDKHDRICDECPVYKLTDRGYRSCRHVVLEEAVALIKELTEKLEIYRQELGEVRVALAEANNDKRELTEENERLSQSLANSKSILANSKADTVQKMQERLKASRYMAHPDGKLEMIPSIESVRADTANKMRDTILRRSTIIDGEDILYGLTYEQICQISKEIAEGKG